MELHFEQHNASTEKSSNEKNETTGRRKDPSGREMKSHRVEDDTRKHNKNNDQLSNPPPPVMTLALYLNIKNYSPQNIKNTLFFHLGQKKGASVLKIFFFTLKIIFEL